MASPSLDSPADLVGLAAALGAGDAAGLSPGEARLIDMATRAQGLRGVCSSATLRRWRRTIADGCDPLGEAFCRLRPARLRRDRGATFTPQPIVEAMLDAADCSRPSRVVDPGCGSGRFLLAAGRRFAAARLIGVELDPLVALLARANLAAAGLARRGTIVRSDYCTCRLPRIAGTTLFTGNPPYVRHHRLAPRAKRWLKRTAENAGLPSSQLAGLHVHFLLATLGHAVGGDAGAFITAAEWLDVNYGALARGLFAGPLGGYRLDLFAADAAPFPDAATTAVIAYFRVGQAGETIEFRRLRADAPAAPPLGRRLLRRSTLEAAPRWSHLARAATKYPAGLIELGEICHVHRGQVTGSNRVWIAAAQDVDLPDEVYFPSVTRAAELFAAGDELSDAAGLRRVIDLPAELDQFAAEQRRAIDRFLRRARTLGAERGYIARHRRPWWRVGLREPAPILATYMARRPPAFVVNRAAARHINIAHGLYPRTPLGTPAVAALAAHLRGGAALDAGRTYAGGLTKFEPGELARLRVPRPEALVADGLA